MGSSSRRSQVKTNGPQMGNSTIEVYLEHRSVSRSRDSAFFPGDVNEETMRADENDILFTFIREEERVATRDTYEYGSHVGMPVFSCLNGIDMDRYQFMNSVRVVGVAKSHTTGDDAGPTGITEFASYIGGTFTIINNGKKLIPMQVEIIVMIYDNVHNPEMFKDLFMEQSYAGYRGGEDIRILGVAEPYAKSDSLMDTIRRFGRAEDFIVESDENLLPGAGVDEPKFGVAEKVEVMEDGLADILMMGAHLYFMFEILRANPGDRVDANLENGFVKFARRHLVALKTGITTGVAKPVAINGTTIFMESVLKGTSSTNQGITKGIYKVLTMKGGMEKLDQKIDRDNPAHQNSYHGRVAANQNGLRKFYSGLKGLVMWEREWIIGKSTKTAAPGEACDLIIRR